MTFSKFVFLLPVLFVVGCSTESTKNKDVGFNEPNRYKGVGNFRIDAITANSTVNAEYNKYSILTKKLFNFKACIKDPLYAAVQAALPFAILDGQGNEERQLTDDKGCIYWSETHSFRFIDQESYIKIRRRIISKNFYKGYVDAEVALNPWADGGSAILDLRYNALPANAEVIDMQDLSIRGQQLRSSADPQVQLNLKSVSFDFIGLDYDNYEVTPYLGLKVAHKYQFRITPSLIRRTINRLVVPEVLNTGRMKAVLVILKEDSNPQTQYTMKNVVTTAEFVGDLVYGELTGDASIKFNSVAELTSRTIGLVTLVPLDDLEGFPKVSFVGPLAPGLLKNLSLRPISQDALSLHKNYQFQLAEIQKQVVKPTELFAKHSGFKPIDFVTIGPQFQRNNRLSLKSQIENFIKKPTNQYSSTYFDLALSMCAQMYSQVRGQDYVFNNCLRHPQAYVKLVKMKFVEKLNSTKPIPDGIPTVDNFKMATSMSVSTSTSTAMGVNLKAGLAQPLGGLGVLKFSFGADYSFGASAKKDKSQSTSVSRERTITAEGNQFIIDAVTRECFAAQVPDSNNSIIANNRSAQGVYFCSQETKNEKIKENYYLVNSKVGVDGSPFSDNASNASTGWRMMIRGSETKNLFATLLEDSLIEFVLFKRDQSELDVASQFKELNLVVDSHQNELFPGLVSVETR